MQVFLLVHKRDQTLIVQRRARILKLVECETRDLAGPAKVNVLRVKRCQGDLPLSHQCGGAKDHLLVLRQRGEERHGDGPEGTILVPGTMSDTAVLTTRATTNTCSIEWITNLAVNRITGGVIAANQTTCSGED